MEEGVTKPNPTMVRAEEEVAGAEVGVEGVARRRNQFQEIQTEPLMKIQGGEIRNVSLKTLALEKQPEA